MSAVGDLRIWGYSKTEPQGGEPGDGQEGRRGHGGGGQAAGGSGGHVVSFRPVRPVTGAGWRSRRRGCCRGGRPGGRGPGRRGGPRRGPGARRGWTPCGGPGA